MKSDVSTLQNIADSLKEESLASQQVLAENAGMSIELMNAVIKRFVERVWLMLTTVNLRKLSYAITPKGISELATRRKSFAKRTLAIANKYNDTICTEVSEAKMKGKDKLALYDNSYIKFILIYGCQTLNITFIEKVTTDSVDPSALCIVGEQTDEADINHLTKQGCVNLLDLIEE